jgi:hypothetical protein
LKLLELMQGKTPSPDYAGIATNDDFVLAVATSAIPGGPTIPYDEYDVVQAGVTHHEGSIDSETDDKQYIRTGKQTTRTGAQRTFSIEGDRMVGDVFQDWVLSNAIKFGVGSSVVRPYIYFNILTGIGEKGNLMFDVQDDQSGDAGENAGFSVDAHSTATPEEYTYTPLTGN